MVDNSPLAISFEAEAVLNSLQFPERPMVTKKCKGCGDVFKSTYNAVAYCSDHCRRIELGKTYGMSWINEQYKTKSEVERWGGYVPPMIIPQQALAVMKYLVLNAESSQGIEIEPWSPQTSRRKPPKPPSQPSSNVEPPRQPEPPKDISEPVLQQEDTQKQGALSEFDDLLAGIELDF